MRIKKVKDNNGATVILFSETKSDDYLYNAPLNLINDLQPDSEYVRNKTYSKMPSKFYSYEVICSAKIA